MSAKRRLLSHLLCASLRAPTTAVAHSRKQWSCAKRVRVRYPRDFTLRTPWCAHAAGLQRPAFPAGVSRANARTRSPPWVLATPPHSAVGRDLGRCQPPSVRHWRRHHCVACSARLGRRQLVAAAPNRLVAGLFTCDAPCAGWAALAVVSLARGVCTSRPRRRARDWDALDCVPTRCAWPRMFARRA